MSNLLRANRSSRTPAVTIRPSAGGYGRVAEIAVSENTVRSLRTQVADMRTLPDYDADPEALELAAEAILAFAAPELVEAIERVASLSGKPPALMVIRGLQVCQDPVLTPTDGVARQEDVAVEAVVLAGVMRHFGLAGTAYAEENGGRLIRAVCPVKEVSNTASSQGAAADLGSHADNGHLPIFKSNDVHPAASPPAMNSHQFFTTITPDASVPMRVKLNDDAFARFDPRGSDPTRIPQFQRLFEPLYNYASSPSHGEVHWMRNLPLLVRLDSHRFGSAMRLHTGTTEANTPAAVEALELLKRAVALTPEEVIHTRRGDIIGYLNTGVTHRREPFDARFDGSDRYYLRIYGNPRSDIVRWAGRMTRNGRVM